MATTIALAGGPARAEDPTGTWVMDNGKITVRLMACGEDICGKIVAMKKPLDKQGNPKRDKHNPDPALRGRPVIGLTILAHMKQDGEKTWEGEIYNPDDGNTYASSMKLDGERIRVKGCFVFICEKMTFNRVD